MAVSLTDAQVELISSLGPDDIPIKLRCAICSKLAVNAFRLPCCEQAICEACQSNLPSSCPVCEHSPLSAEDCNPHKSLRTTIKVFLRTAERKRDAARPKEQGHSAPPTPLEAAKPQLPVEKSVEDVANQQNASEQAVASVSTTEQPAGQEQTAEPAPVHQDEEPVHDQNPPSGDLTSANEGEGPENATNEHEVGTTAAAGNTEEPRDENNDVSVQGGTGDVNYGTDGTNGGFSNMNDFNQMQMMMAMQNGMAPNFGGFPMMGMPGMGMDPMTMQNMYMNGGFQGMGMNGMGGFGGGFGQGSNDNWNGSQSWNFDQNNYNQSGSGMGAGDFGNFNSGFQTGYNQQGNYGHQFNDHRRGGFGRGRGRGRGFHGGAYSRGGYQQYGGNYSHPQFQGQYSQTGTGTEHPTNDQAGEQPGEHGAESSQLADRSADSEQPGETNTDAGRRAETGSISGVGTPTDASRTVSAVPVGPSGPSNGPVPIRSVTAAVEAPINAPTGPKAMRQGLPNTSLFHLRARGYQVGDEPGAAAEARDRPGRITDDRGRARSNTPNSRDGAMGANDPRSDDAGHQRDPYEKGQEQGETGARSASRAASRSRSRSHSRSRGHRSSRRHHGRRRSISAGAGTSDEEYSRKRRRSRSRKRHSDDDDGDVNGGQGDDRHNERTRSMTPDSSKRSSVRDRADRETEKRRDRDADRYDDGASRKKSSRRSHRDRDYDSSKRRDRHRERDGDHNRDRERDRTRDRDRNRGKDRDRDRDRDGERLGDKDRRDRKDRHRDRGRDRDTHKHSGGGGDDDSRRHSLDGQQTPTERDFKPPTGPRASRPAHDQQGHERRASKASAGGEGRIPKGPAAKDPHTLEREARNRERLLKEAQRMAGLASFSGGKRGRDAGDGDGDGASGRSKGRKMGRRSDAADGGDREERMRKLEAEREGERWG